VARKKKPQQEVKTGADHEAYLIQEISDCDEVLKHLDNCPVWRIIVEDLDEQKKIIDDNWHTLTDEKQIQECRITKFAIMYLLNIRAKYESNLEKAQRELREYTNQDKEIIKDYDTETLKEG